MKRYSETEQSLRTAFRLPKRYQSVSPIYQREHCYHSPQEPLNPYNMDSSNSKKLSAVLLMKLDALGSPVGLYALRADGQCQSGAILGSPDIWIRAHCPSSQHHDQTSELFSFIDICHSMTCDVQCQRVILNAAVQHKEWRGICGSTVGDLHKL